MFAAGYDIVNDLDGVLEEFDKVLGLELLRAIHLNDSYDAIWFKKRPACGDRRRRDWDRGTFKCHASPEIKRPAVLSGNATGMCRGIKKNCKASGSCLGGQTDGKELLRRYLQAIDCTEDKFYHRYSARNQNRRV